jgi:endonuclease YncB( thermonuclease family)
VPERAQNSGRRDRARGPPHFVPIARIDFLVDILMNQGGRARENRLLPQCCRIPALRLTTMMGWRDGVLAAAFAAEFAVLFGCCCVAAQEQQHAIPCGGETFARGIVSRVIDGRTFVLDDGREIRLAAIEVPAPPRPLEPDAAPGGPVARDALAALIGGDEVVLRRADAPSDRYERLLAYAYAVRDGEELFAQGEQISAGFARVGDRIGNKACAAELRGRENAARQARLGLWANSYYEMLHADNPADVLAQRGRFALVEGKVVSVRENGATIYVNFGRRWIEDFAVTILKRNARNFTAAGLEPEKLAGRRVRVRGWIEERGGPRIEAARPEQIEITDRE